MKKLIYVLFIMTGAFVVICAGSKAVKDIRQDPNNVAVESQPRQIVMPKGTKLPAQYKCPEHGIITSVVTMDIDGSRKVYCKKCAMIFVSRVFDLNLPKLEIVK